MFDQALPAALPTRDRLVQAAADLMMRHSYATISVDGICAAAEVKKGTFYHHFASKVDLALAVFDHVWKEGEAVFGPCFDPALPPLERLKKFAEASAAHHRETFKTEGKVYGCPLANAGYEMGAQDERIRQKVQSLFNQAVVMLGTIVADLPPYKNAAPEKIDRIARELMSYSMGVEYQAKLANDPEVIARDLYPGFLRLVGVPDTETKD